MVYIAWWSLKLFPIPCISVFLEKTLKLLMEYWFHDDIDYFFCNSSINLILSFESKNFIYILHFHIVDVDLSYFIFIYMSVSVLYYVHVSKKINLKIFQERIQLLLLGLQLFDLCGLLMTVIFILVAFKKSDGRDLSFITSKVHVKYRKSSAFSHFKTLINIHE